MSGNNGSNASFGSAKNGGNSSNGSNGDKVIVGGSGDDRLNGGSGNDTIDGGAGDDRLNGGSGDDRLTGGSGQDDIDGGSGNDTIDGGVGNDDLRGGSGDDIVDGGAGHDEIDGGSGNDVIDGGAGWDRVGAGAGDDVATYNFAENRGFNFDIYDGGSGTDTLRLEFTREEWMRADVQADVKRFLSYLSLYNSNSAGRGRCDDDDIDNDRDDDGSGFFPFLFRSTGLLAADFEKLEVVVDGVLLDARDQAVVLAADTISTTEDAASIAIDLLANDSVPDLIAGVTVTQPAHGTVTLTLALTDPQAPPTAHAVYTPSSTYFQLLAVGQSATDSFTYTVTDADGDVATQTVTVTVTGTNDAPVAVADAAAGNENEVVTVDVLANDSDVDDGHVFTLVSVAAPVAKGVASIVENRLVFTPGTDFDHLAAGAEEVVVVAYTMRDEHGAQASATAAIRITGTNDGPVAVADAASAAENQALTVDVLANDRDVDDGHAFTLVSVEAPAGKGAASVAENQLVFTPGSDFDHLAQGAQETVTVSYLMRDEHGAESSSVLTILVTGTNDGPVAVADPAAGTENETLVVDVLANDTDVDDGHVFTLVAADAPAGKGSASVVDNALVFTPGTDFDHLAEGAQETVTVSYLMRDEHGAESSSVLTILVTGTNDGPVAVADAAAGTENETLVVDVLANDTDVDDGHVFTLVAAEAPAGKGAASVAENRLVFTPGTDFDHLAQGVQETVTVSYLMRDEHGAESSSTLTITVTGTNDGPVAVADSAGGTENQALTIDVLGNDMDVDDGHVFTLVSADAPAGKGAASIVDNQLVFTPGASFDHLADGAQESVLVTYLMQDEHGAQSSATLTITVTGTNDAPVAVADSGTGTENQVRTLNVLANDTDVDDGAAFTLLSASAPAGKGVASVAGNQLVFNPGTDFDHLKQGAIETVTLSYTMRDQHGAESTSTVAYTVTGVNDAPVVSGPVTGTATEDGSVSTLSAIANASDVDDGTVLNVANLGALPAGVTYNAAAKSFTLDPGHATFQSLALGATRTVGVAYAVSDGITSVPATVSWVVTGVNDGPVAVSDALTTLEYVGSYRVSDGVNWSTNPPVYSAAEAAAKLFGGTAADYQISINASRDPSTITHTGWYDGWGKPWTVFNEDFKQDAPPAGYYQPFGDAWSALVADHVDYSKVNYVWRGEGGAYTSENNGFNLAPAKLLANDTDIDAGDVLTIVAVSSVSAQGGSVVLKGDGTISYDPGTALDHLKQGATVTDSFSYTISDNKGGSSSATVTFTVEGRNDAPVVTGPLAISATEDGTGSTLYALANASDVDDGTVLNVVNIGALPAGVTYNAATKSFTLDPSHGAYQSLAAGQQAVVTVSYAVSDGIAPPVATSASWTVTGVNDAPVAVADTAAGAENQIVSINVLANDTDVDSGAVKTLVSGSAPAGQGSVSLSGNQLVFDPGTDFDHLAPGESEVVSLSYTMRDQLGAQSSSTVSYAVTGTNDAPRLDLDVPEPTTNPTAINELFKLNGSATQVSANLLQLTPDATSLSGSAFSLKKLDLSQSMTFDFDIFVGYHDVPGADGVAMVLHNDPRGATATGGFGIGLGVAGIQNGLAIEFDTYSNAGEPVQDHTSIIRTSNFTSVTPVQTLGNIEDGQFHRVVVSWNAATQTLSYTIDGIPRGTLTGDLATQYFGGSQTVFFGFTGGTGGEGNLQQVRINSITGVLADAAPAYPTYTENGAPVAIAGGNVDVDDWGERDLTSLTVTVGGLRDGGSEQLTIGSATAQLNANQSGTVAIAGEAFNYAYNAATGALTVTAADGRIDPSALEALIGSMTYADLGEAPTAGTRSFAFTVTDASGATAPTQTARIDVVPVNDAPVVAGPVTGTATEDGALATLSALANSSDVDSAMSVVNVPTTLPAGVSYNAATRTFTLNPADAAYQALAAGQTMTVAVAYGVSDGSVTVPTSASWTVTGTNDAPVVTSNAAAAAGTLIEEGHLDDGTLTPGVSVATGTLTSSDADNGATAAWSVVNSSNGLYGQLTITPAGVWTYKLINNLDGTKVLAEGQTVTETFTVRVSDGLGGTADRIITLTVQGTNDRPFVESDQASVVEDNIVTGSVASNDVDTDAGDVLTYTLNAPVAGLTLNASGSYSLDAGDAAYQSLAQGATQDVIASYAATDSHGASAATSLAIKVTGTNDAPSALALSNASILESAAPGTVVGTLAGTDADAGAALSYVATGGRTDLFEIVGDQLRLKSGAEIDHEAVPSHSLSVRVSDQFGASFDRTFMIDVANANEAPVWNLAVNGDFERGPFVNNGLGWMSLGNGSTTIPGWTVTGSGGVDWHIADDTQGRLFLDLAGSGPGGVTQTLATVAGGLYRVDFDLAANPAFASTETIVVSAASASQSFSFDAAGRSLQDMGWQATSMTFTANAPSTALNFASASPNDSVGPALDNVRTTLIGFGAIEDTVLSSSVRAVDPDGDALTYSLVSGTTHGSLTLNANGSFTYTPDANYNGADSFQVKASDGAASAVQTFSIGVAAANDAPTIVPSGATFDGSAHVGIAGPAIFTGAGGYSYEVTFKTSSTGIYQTLLSVGVFTTNKASEFVIGPDGKLNFGVNNAHVSVITSAGSVADGQWHTATATYNGSGQLALYLDGALVGTSSYAGVSLTGGVAMIGAANTDIRNHFVGEIAEAHVWNRGLSAAEATNQSTPSPTDAGLIGSYLFSSGTTANAASGLPDGANVGVTFSVSGGVREIAEGAAGEGSAISSTSGAILFKDVDAGDSHGATFTPNGAGYLGSFSLAVDQALDRANWQFTVADAAIEHLAAGQVLAQSYTVTVTDAAGAPVSQVVTVTIAGTNDAPVVANAIPDRSVNEDTSWTYTIAGNAFSDVDSASLTYAARSLGGGALPAWLSFDAATRTFSGTPPTNFNGTVALQVTASDGSLSVTDAFNLNVAPVNDAPVLANAIPDRTVNEDSAWSYTMAANSFTDVDNPTLTYAASLSGGGALPSWLGFNAATRTFTGTPPANFNGTVGLTVTASDGSFSVSDGFILSVLPVADMPTLSVGSSTVLQPTVGAAAAYTASLTAGQAFTFNWNFVAGDYLPYNDFAFVSVNGVVTSLALVEVVGDYGGTGWRTYSFTAPTTGSYTIGIGVANDRDTSFISDLLVDNVRIGGVSVASFESSISPFAISGTVTRASAFSTTNAPVVQSPTDGAFMLRINGTPTSAAALETFVGAPAGSLALAATPTGHAGKPIAVPVNVTTPPGDLQDTYILIKGMPAGATFSLGSYDAALGGWKVDASALGGNLTMTTSVTGNHTLTITATSFASETNTTQTTAAKSVSITVLAGTGSDPLVFDLGGDGVSFLTADAGVTFDLDGDGTAEATGWLTAGDGLLVLDLDGSGAIEDGTEVLSETFLGLDFANSLDALRFLDDNEDGVIDAGDEAYSTLRLWADADGDGVSDAGELHGFAEMGIVSIDLSATELDATQDRQDLLGSAAFSFEDGSVGTYYVVQLNQPALVPAGEFLG